MNSRDPAVRPGIDVHQFYRLDMPQTASAALADIFSFTGSRGICEPTKYTIRFTHPQHDLSRAGYLNQIAGFVIQPPPGTRWSEPEAARRIPGVVTRFAQLSSSPDQSVYEIVLESRLALLRNSPKIRFFFDRTEPEIIGQILREHEFNQLFADFRLDLYQSYRKHPVVTQWCEDDLTFITRLCRRTGMWFVCEQGEHCEVVRFGDDFTHYRHDTQRFTAPYREPDGLFTGARESVQSLEMHAASIPANYAVRNYSPEEPHGRVIDGDAPVVDDRTTQGMPYTWGTPYLSEAEAKQEAQLRQEAALAAQVVYTGTCDMLDLAPACVLELSNRELADVKYGLLVTRMTCSASRREGYKAAFTAIPGERQYRHALEEHTWPRIEGVITGTIGATKGYVGPYLDEQGRYIVHLHADREPRVPGLDSCPMRLAKPFAGPGQTGFHFGLEPGTVVTVAFLWGNPDLPFISQVLHTAQHTDPIVSGYPWAQRHTIRTRSNNTFQMDDHEGREHIKVATEQGKSQLNLGHMVDRGQNGRGDGAELRTDGPAALRGGGGVMVSAYARNGASGRQLDMQETVAQLEDALAVAKALASSAQASKAEAADTGSQHAVNRALDQLGQSGVVVTTPASTGVVAGGSVQFVAGENIIGVAKGDASWSVWKRFTVAAHDMVSLFTQKGMSLIAAAGAVVVQAQRGRMQLAAQEDMTVETVNGVLHVKSPREIVLNVGGSYFRMTPAGIEMGTRGGVVFRTGSMKKTGPAQMDLGGEAFAPQFVPYTTQCEVWRTNPDFVPALASAPDPEQREELANPGAVLPAPSLDAGSMQSAGGRGDLNPGSMEAIGQPLDRSSAATGDGSGSDVDLTVSDPDNAPKDIKIPAGNNGKDGGNYVVPSITLGKPAPCNWVMENFSQLSAHDMEIKAYYPWIDEKTKYECEGQWRLTPGGRKSRFDVGFDNKLKILTASVKIGVILKDIHEIDFAKNDLVRLKDGTIKSVPYDSFGNGANATEVKPKNLKFVDRDSTEYDFSAKAKLINGVLNQNSYKLILDGCAKGPQCGCRVSIKFDVAFFVIKESERLSGPYHSVINLYPYAFRDDTGSWGEVVAKFDDKDGKYERWEEDYAAAHECGHFFNYPDEYFRAGGAVHEQYVEERNLQFERGRQLAGSETWQMASQPNLMGSGGRNRVNADPLPRVPPYYMEYLRRWMTKHTNKKWRVGVNVA